MVLVNIYKHDITQNCEKKKLTNFIFLELLFAYTRLLGYVPLNPIV